jgi:hypothetical protein
LSPNLLSETYAAGYLCLHVIVLCSVPSAIMVVTSCLLIGLMTIAVKAFPQPQAAQPASPPPATPAAAKAISAADLGFLSGVVRFQKLLTEGGKGEKLLSGDNLKKQIVFPFSPPAKTDTTPQGGFTVAANTGNFPILTGLSISTTLGLVEPCGINTP